MENLIQDNSALEERLNKHGSRLYNLENLNIPQKVSKFVDEIITDVADWALQALLCACFRELPEADMKEILLQRMWEIGSYKTHEDHKNLYEALETSMDRDHSDQLQADLTEARKKRQKRSDSPRTPSGSPLPPPPPPPPSSGTYGALGAPRALGRAPSSSKTIASTQQSMAWTTSDNRYESASFTTTQETSPTNNLMNDDFIPDEQVHLSDDEDTGNDHLPKADLRKDWWKPLPEEERPATPEPAWTIPSSNVSDVENNWASALVSTYEPPAENSLLAKTGDMKTFMNWYSQKVNKTVLTQADFDGQAYEVANPEGDQVRIDVSRPLSLGGPPGHVTIQTQFFFNKDLEYLRYGNKGSRPALSISKMKAASYPDFGLELLVPEQLSSILRDMILRRIEEKSKNTCGFSASLESKAYSRYWCDYLSEIVLRRANFHEHKIAKRDFKNLYPSDFEDLNFLLLQGHLDHLPGFKKCMLSTAVKLWTQNLVIRQRVEDFQLGIESYQTQLNLTKPGWDDKGFEFKHNYTLIESPRAVVFPINNNE
ncbi:hypothetical protein Tco_0320291 [Tanacetum coccineum]